MTLRPHLNFALAFLTLSSMATFAEDSPKKPATYVSPEQAAADPDFAIQGEYVTPEGDEQQKGIQVVALGDGLFRVVLYNGGLPGEGWDRKLAQVIEEEERDLVQDLLGTMQARKVSRTSPTMGAKPPTGAIVLFDGTQESLNQHWKKGAKLNEQGYLASGATSTDQFQDYSLHLEFRTPYMPAARGQARGNSGVYHQGRYETQVLDSFGLKGLNNETGGIYTVRDPDINMCLPPLSWQTYDVDFTAPRFDSEGKKIANARMTVRLNGVVVQRDVEVPGPTRAAPFAESPAAGPIYLQDHGNPVSYRNIWVIPRNADQEARRPRIPGYERFFAFGDREEDGGLILLGELGCMNCHEASAELRAIVLPKQAPVLTDVGNRVNPDWMAKFIANPHAVKPGTTMPGLFEGWSEADRTAAIQALVSFLVGEGTLPQQFPQQRRIAAGEKLFHTIGCVACHEPQNGTVVPTATSVPLANLSEKYTIPSLAMFLRDPHAVRPSGRMPSLNLNEDEADQIAQYLLRQRQSKYPPNVKFQVYEGHWEKLPNFDEMTPVEEGTCVGFDLNCTSKKDFFGVRFEGYLPSLGGLTAQFQLMSDDGARLWIDGVEVINNDGVHPPHTQTKTARLDKVPLHKVRLDYFEASGGEELSVQVNLPGKPANDLGLLLQLTDQQTAPSAVESASASAEKFSVDPSLAPRGRELFASLGCANCHELKRDNQLVASTLKARPLAGLNLQAGCLSETPQSSPDHPLPDYDLVAGQRRDLTAACSLAPDNRSPDPVRTIERTLTAFNCYACHERNGLGGPEPSRNELFVTPQHEMGDEGRLPPMLSGVGDKLQDNWLKTVLDQGANHRPYMLTRMPRFGSKNVGHLQAALIAEDRRNDADLAEFDEPLHRVKGAGRMLVGNGGLACIKCHTFGKYKATGIQAISLTDMTKRLRKDWFLRYLFDPIKYRPGTRMPTGFPNGQAVIQDIYDGDPNKQITAIWEYLMDGDRAGLPEGLIAKVIELKPEMEPILYRNFFADTSPRGIAVGYPEKANLIWDIDELCLRKIWHDRFMDASMHWTGRGQGQQYPMGDHILLFETRLSLAQLSSPEAPWPTESVRAAPGYQFRSYQLNDKGQPAFRYDTPFGQVIDFPEPVPVNDKEGTFRRKLTVTPRKDAEGVYFRAAVGSTIQPDANSYRVNDTYNVRISGGGQPLIRTSNGQQELLVPLQPGPDGTVTVTQEILW